MPQFITRKGRQTWATTPVFMRRLMPYGKWTTAEGREVLFDREYAPICDRWPGRAPAMCNPREWVTHVDEEWYYDDGVPEKQKRQRAEAVLRQWGVYEMVMADIMRRMPRSRRPRV